METDFETNKEVENTEKVNFTKEVDIMKEENMTKEVSINKEIVPDFKNVKEKLYDKIPISLKALDVFIAICVIALIVMIAYFIIRRYF